MRIIVVSRHRVAARQSLVDPQDSRPQRRKQGARPGAPVRRRVARCVRYRGAESMGYSWMTVNFLRQPSAGSVERLVVSIPLTQ
jgi:hypothetical protein